MTKISDLTALLAASVDPAADLVPVVDMSAAGAARNKKMTFDELATAMGDILAAAPSYRGAMVKKAADETGANFTTAAAIAWDAEEEDTDAFHDNVTNNSRLTVPSGVTRVRVGVYVQTANTTANNTLSLRIRKNGSTSFMGGGGANAESSFTSDRVQAFTWPIAVTAGDYFEAFLQSESDTAIDIVAAESWFAIQVVD